MRLCIVLGLAGALFLSGCDTPVNSQLVSATPASAQQFTKAKRAAAICTQHFPNWSAVIAGFKSNGYLDSNDSRFQAIARNQNAAILEAPGSDVVVMVGQRTKDGACIIGLKGMTPEQSYQLALPMVSKFNALTNAERGQGLAKNAVQAWGIIESDHVVYIAAYKEWDVLGEPGAGVRLLHSLRY